MNHYQPQPPLYKPAIALLTLILVVSHATSLLMGLALGLLF